jgi:predicted TIM-barrel fold metal-dependent hydrolase
MLMFATDYPHDHVGEIGALLSALPEGMAPRVMYQNARDLYGG